MHCVGGQPLVSVRFVAVLITLFWIKTFSLLVCTPFYITRTSTPRAPAHSYEVFGKELNPLVIK